MYLNISETFAKLDVANVSNSLVDNVVRGAASMSINNYLYFWSSYFASLLLYLDAAVDIPDYVFIISGIIAYNYSFNYSYVGGVYYYYYSSTTAIYGCYYRSCFYSSFAIAIYGFYKFNSMGWIIGILGYYYSAAFNTLTSYYY